MAKKLENRFQQEVQHRRRLRQKRDGDQWGLFLVIAGLAILLGYGIHKVRASSTGGLPVEPSTLPAEWTRSGPPKPPRPQAVALPPSGVKKVGSKPDEPVAKLRFFVRAPLPSEQSGMSASCREGGAPAGVKNPNHYYVELLDWQSGRIVTTAFVRSNDMVEIPVPVGAYKLRYAEGTEWYGDRAMFGSQDMYEMTEKYASTATRLEFNENSGYDISVQCTNGNSGRKPVTKSPLEDLPTTNATGT